MKSIARGFGRAALGALMLVSAAGVALAQANVMKPGLWEMKMGGAEMDAARAQMKAQLDKMSPEQRAQMEKMMSQNGAAMGADGSVKICHTAQTLQRDGLGKAEPGCDVRHSTRGALTIMDMTCKNGRTGHGEFTVTPDSVKGFFEGSDPSHPGKMRMEQSGRWLGADCGAVKPLGAASKG